MAEKGANEAGRQTPGPQRTESWIEPDPVIEAFKKDVDRTLLRENLRRSVDERLRDLMRLQRFAVDWREAAKRTFG